jgi:hypothetical protein
MLQIQALFDAWKTAGWDREQLTECYWWKPARLLNRGELLPGAGIAPTTLSPIIAIGRAMVAQEEPHVEDQPLVF